MRGNRSLVIRAIYAACLLGATYNHASTLITHGVFWNYGGVPWPSAVFWTSLTLADPVAAMLLFIRPRIGVIATAAIITSDVLHNLWITWLYASNASFLQDVAADRNMMEQIAFLIFVAATFGMAMPDLRFTTPRATSAHLSRSAQSPR